MKSAVVLMVVFVMMLVMVAPASAGAPVVETFEFEGDGEYADNPCPGVNIWKHEDFTVRETYYFDKQGNVKRIKGHADGIDSFYNPANPDVVLSGHFVVNYVKDPKTDEYLKITGAYYHITAPGYGTVLMRAGLVVSPDGHVAGKDSFINQKDIDQFCSIMAGD